MFFPNSKCYIFTIVALLNHFFIILYHCFPFRKLSMQCIYNYIYIHMLWKPSAQRYSCIHTYTHTYMPASIHEYMWIHEYMNMWIHTYSVTFAGYIAHCLSVSSPLAPQITSNHSNQDISPPNWDNNKNHPNIKKSKHL